MKFTKNSTLEKIYQNKKEAKTILGQNGVPCISCPMAEIEINSLKIGDVARIYGLDIQKIIKELNGK